ncbi:mitochondrial ribosomal protein S11 [Dermatophagoides farinae]|uniref:28S ribosomal protein S11, mitochondrial n=1 Tax=Dermatophagoides farinae TaxID=6954 RepID=A0A922I8D5_DERFA|nr:30S ribosomal protein S11-like [Dermatophagoides farinae]KAH7641474.1 30s ribosomal protein s11-like protein [Dermatophagoides farinae]KAH9527287.1 28S ribosomal protein S11, mitochondrial [Dermatophagoides farinae]
MIRSIFQNQLRSIHTSRLLWKAEDKRIMLKSMPKKDEGAHGERSIEVETTGFNRICEFPAVDTPERLFDNIPFKLLPIIHIKSTKNNTLFQLTTHDGTPITGRACGSEGFKNCRKGTNIAAQVTGTSFGKIILKMGYKTCRVCINGLGPGRMSSFKGLQLAGIDIVSITDSTYIVDYPKARPPAARSL